MDGCVELLFQHVAVHAVQPPPPPSPNRHHHHQQQAVGVEGGRLLLALRWGQAIRLLPTRESTLKVCSSAARSECTFQHHPQLQPATTSHNPPTILNLNQWEPPPDPEQPPQEPLDGATALEDLLLLGLAAQGVGGGTGGGEGGGGGGVLLPATA